MVVHQKPEIIPYLEFSIEFQSNQLIYQKEYTKRQQIIYVLIKHLHDREGWGYRKISQWLNKSGIKTLRGKNWFNSSVISVLKRKHERDLMNEQIRNQYFPSKVSKFEVNYYNFIELHSRISLNFKTNSILNKLFVFLFSIFFSLNSYGEWRFHSSSLQGDTFHIHTDTIMKDERYVYFWYMKSYLMPNKFGDFSSKVYVQGDCNNNRLKYLTYVWYKEPMGKGLGERSDEESEWEYPTAESVGIDLLHDVCNI